MRGLQSTALMWRSCPPGSRAAVNLAGVDRGEVSRGDTLAPADSLILTQRLDVELRVLPQAPYAVKKQFHPPPPPRRAGADVPVYPAGRDRLEPGEAGFAQLRLDQPLAARAGDRFVVRFFSPVVTVGGGVALDLEPPAKGRMDPARLIRLAALAAGEELPRPAEPVEEGPPLPAPETGPGTGGEAV